MSFNFVRVNPPFSWSRSPDGTGERSSGGRVHLYDYKRRRKVPLGSFLVFLLLSVGVSRLLVLLWFVSFSFYFDGNKKTQTPDYLSKDTMDQERNRELNTMVHVNSKNSNLNQPLIQPKEVITWDFVPKCAFMNKTATRVLGGDSLIPLLCSFSSVVFFKFSTPSSYKGNASNSLGRLLEVPVT